VYKNYAYKLTQTNCNPALFGNKSRSEITGTEFKLHLSTHNRFRHCKLTYKHTAPRKDKRIDHSTRQTQRKTNKKTAIKINQVANNVQLYSVLK